MWLRNLRTLLYNMALDTRTGITVPYAGTMTRRIVKRSSIRSTQWDGVSSLRRFWVAAMRSRRAHKRKVQGSLLHRLVHRVRQ